MSGIKNISIALAVALAALVFVAYAKPVKSCIGSFGSINSTKAAEKTWTWKEYFFNLIENTWPEKIVFPPEVNKIGRSFWLETSSWSPVKSKLSDVCFLATDMTWSVNAVAYDSSNITTIRCPYITTIGYPSPIMNGYVHALYIPNVKQFGNKEYIFYTNAKLEIFINESTCSEILAFKNFPGTTAAKYGNLKFHGLDGTVYWDGTAWATTTDGASGQYPYEEDVCPTFVEDEADLYWKDLFFKTTEDTWTTFVVFPANINYTGRGSCFVSSKIEEATFLCSSFSFANNPLCSGSPNCRVVKMPNIESYNYPGPTMNGRCTSLYIPKCKMFSNNIALGTNKERLDVYIDESTCNEILAMKNFPSCTGAMRSKVFFHGSDGTISFDGTNWVVNND